MSERPDDMLERDLADSLTRPRPADANWRSPMEQALARSRDLPQRRARARLAGLFSGGLRFATAAAAAAVTVAVAVLAVNLIGLVRDQQPTGILPSPMAVDGFVVARAPVPAEEPVAAVVADGAVWVATLGAQLHRLDATTGLPISVVDLPGNACGPVTTSPGSIWVLVCPAGPVSEDAPTSVVRIDTTTEEITGSVQLGGHVVAQPAVLGDTLWVVEQVADGVLRPIDLDTAVAGAPITIGTEVSAITAGLESLWLSAPEQRALLRLDPAQGEVVDSIGLPGEPGVLIVHGQSVWVALTDAHQMVRVDPERRAVTATVGIDERVPVQLGVAGSAIWALTPDELLRIDAIGVRVVERWAVGEHSVEFPPQFSGPTYAMALGDGIWFVPPSGDMVRIKR